ncbi:MAG TPA: glycosyltransferase 87 family protein [Acidobacteriaceae bacterium]|jgi:hypothetical protein|nr:glycosyltransferase 87 family protein [Acidobacteriaceae bacterium]
MPRVVRWLEGAALLLASLYLGLHTLPRAWRTLNTDFPNYYMAARLVHEGYDTTRMYEWSWIEREKDHRAVDLRVIGLLPITPISTLAIYPFVELAPLTAKHVWIVLNLGLLIPIGWMLRWMTGLSIRRIALALLLSFPLHRNLLFGQFYVLLLLLIVAACWSYLRGFRLLAGALLALAAVCKIFPLLLFVFFLQRREWRALAAGGVAGLAATALSIGVFGWNVHRTWLLQILPWVLHGEGLQPYVASASISSVLHRLFLVEPQWNPHPWHSSPLAYALLMSALSTGAFAPAILLIRGKERKRSRILLEWSALLTASLAISTLPASYNFVLMAFPVCVLASILLERRQLWWLAALVLAYLGIGFPLAVPRGAGGLAMLLYVPRLPLMFAVLLSIYALLGRDRVVNNPSRDWTRWAWGAAMLAWAVFSVHSTLRLERGQRQEYAYRLPLQGQGFLNSSPQPAGSGVRFIAFTFGGYHLVQNDPASGGPADGARSAGADSDSDELSFSSGFGHLWVEQASKLGSQIADLRRASSMVIDNARDPMLSADGQSLAFVRDDHGRGRLMLVRIVPPVRMGGESPVAAEAALTPPRLNVDEASYLSARLYAFAAVENGKPPQIYLTDATHRNAPLLLGESRYPDLSPDGRWMAYSRLEGGVWNLWVRNQATGATRRIADVPCNQIQPKWERDAKTLLYGTDCGRSVWFTAIAQRRVLP